MQDDVLSPGSGTGQPILTHCCWPLLHKGILSVPEAQAVGKSQAGTKDIRPNPASPVPEQPHAWLFPLSRKGASPRGPDGPFLQGVALLRGPGSHCRPHPGGATTHLLWVPCRRPTSQRIPYPCHILAPRAPNTRLCPRGRKEQHLARR